MNKLAKQVHPMVPLAKACAALKINREELIQRVSAGELLGEKRRFGYSKRDSWFIYQHELDRLIREMEARSAERVSTNGLEHIFNGESSQQPPVLTTSKNKKAAPAVVSNPVPEPASETVQIDPVAMDHTTHDVAQTVDALGSDYALGTDYDEYCIYPGDFAAPAFSTSGGTIQTSGAPDNELAQAMLDQLGQLMHCLQEERQEAAQLRARMLGLEDEVDSLRRALLEQRAASPTTPFNRVKDYFKFFLPRRIPG